MSWLVQPRLVNGPFDDPGLYLDFRFGCRAILFDLGNLSALSTRELLRVSHAFVSHTHMDHFTGFDRLLRVCLHRTGPLHILGPCPFVDQVEHRLRSYTWNLLDETSIDCRLIISEVDKDRLSTSEFRARDAFRPRDLGTIAIVNGCVLEEDQFVIETAVLDHGTPTLAFALRETMRVNVWRGALEKHGLVPGPWLNAAKRAVRQGRSMETLIEVSPTERVSLGDLMEDVLRTGPGQVVAYVVDCAFDDGNNAKIAKLAYGADQLFIEAVFLQEDAELAVRHRHLTAAQAGHLARLAGARHVTPLHFSARYLDRPEALPREVTHAFQRGPDHLAAEIEPLPKADRDYCAKTIAQ